MMRPILLVFAHPDDESFGLGGTIFKYSRQGAPVFLVCATRGENGSRVGVPERIPTGVARESELRAAAAILGIQHIYFLDYADAGLENVDADEIAQEIAQIMRDVQPEVVITFGPDGITGHPDHIAVGKAATKAFQTVTKAGGVPRKLYYVTVPESVVRNSGGSGVTARRDDEITTVIDIREYFDIKMEAVSAHRSQQDARDFSEMLRKNRGSAFASKEYLYLANMKVSGKETDLFQ